MLDRSFKSILARKIFLALLIFLGSSKIAVAAQWPSFGNWTWPAALYRLNELAPSVGAGCVLWTEAYGTNSYRAWKRCGVSATASGIVREEIFFGGWSGTSTKTGSDGVTLNPNRSMCSFGSSGFNPVGCDVGMPGGGGSYVTGFGIETTTATAFEWAKGSSPGQEVYFKHVSSCTGTALSGSRAPGPYDTSSPRYMFGTGTTKLRGATTGSVSSTCKNADTLLVDFGPIAPTCEAGTTIMARVRGFVTLHGACSCIPSGYAIDHAGSGGSCLFSPITGDPGGIGSHNGEPGQKGTRDGHKFTNEDVDKYGDGKIPVVGEGGEEGFAPMYPGSGGTGDQDSPGGGGGPGAGVGSGSGSGSGDGDGGCTAPECEGGEGGSVPGVPSYSAEIESPEANDWKAAITSWITSSGIATAITGSGVSTSSTQCLFSTTAFGRTIDLDFCPMGPWFAAAAPYLLMLAYLTGFFILWRE